MTDARVLENTLRRTAAILNASTFPYALTGGFAVYARGGGMCIDHDVDFLVTKDDAPQVLALLEAHGYTTDTPPEGWLVKAFDTTTSPPPLVDLIFHPAGGQVLREVLLSCEVMQVCSVPMPVSSATSLMIDKLLSLDVHDCNLAPILLMARVLAPGVNWELVRTAVSHSPYATAFLHLSDSLGVSTCL